MHIAKLTYIGATRRHPKEVQQIIAKLRAGKSKHRLVSPEKLSYSYECCVRLPEWSAGSFEDVLSGKLTQASDEFDALPLEKRVEDQLSRTTTVLKAKIGHWHYEVVVENPIEVEHNIRTSFQAADNERARIAALTPEELAAEQDEILRKLGLK